MNRYFLYGFVIESDVELIQLKKSTDENANIDILIHRKDCSDEVMEYLKKAEALEKQYEIGLSYSCFFNKGGYFIIKNGNEIAYQPKEEYTPEGLSPWLLGYAIGMLLIQRKMLPIHCSAVCTENADGNMEAILISGRSGAGKSSLTRKLLENGYKFMADDVAAVKCSEEALVYPAFPFQKLVRNEVEKRKLDKKDLIYIDEDKDKYLVPVRSVFSDIPAKLKCMLYLMEADVAEVQIRKLSGLEQLMLVRMMICINGLSGAWQNDKAVLNMCLEVAGKCSVYIISRPKNVDSVDAIAKIVKEIDN